MSYKIQKIANLRTVKALRGQSLTIDLGKTFTGTITAWMKKSPSDEIYRSFTTTDNRNLFLSKEKTQDYYDETTLELLSEISGKWYFDVRQLPDGGTADDEKVIFTGTILFEDNITDSFGRELIDPSVPWASSLIELQDVPNIYGTTQQLLVVKPTRDGVEWVNASEIIDFIGLTDTPSTWGNVGDFLRIDSSGNSLEWVAPSNQSLDTTSDVTFNSISGDGSNLTNVFDQVLDTTSDVEFAKINGTNITSSTNPTGTFNKGVSSEMFRTAAGNTANNIAIYSHAKQTGTTKGGSQYGVYGLAESESTGGYDGVIIGMNGEGRIDANHGTNNGGNDVVYGGSFFAKFTNNAGGEFEYAIANNSKTTIDGATTEVEYVQGAHTTVDLKNGTASDVMVQILDFDYTSGSIIGDFAYLNIQDDTVPTPTIGTARSIYSKSTLPSEFKGSIESTSFIKTGGTSSQFLKADGSVDTNTYLTSYIDTNTQRSDEEIRDVAAAQWINGTNTTVVVDDSGNTIKIDSTDTNTQRSDSDINTLIGNYTDAKYLRSDEDDSTTGKLTVGKNVISTYDGSDTNTGAYGVSRTLSGLTANARGYRDESILTSPGNNAVSYAGIDIKTQMTEGSFNHVTMFQGRTSLDNADVTDFEGLYMGGLNFSNTSNVTNYVGVTVENPTAFSGTITNFIGTNIKAPARSGGTMTNFYGLKIEDNVSATNKWAIYSDDDSVNSKMLGQLESGDITVQNTTTAASLSLNSSSTASGGNYIHAKKSDGSNQWVFGSNSALDDRVTLKQYNAADIIFANNSGDAMKINTSGDVSIGGDTQTNRKFKVHGNSAVDGNLYLSGDSSSYSIEVGQSRTTEGLAILDLTGEVSPDDYGLRMIRYAGENAESAIFHTGTSNLRIRAENAADTVFENTNVGIGTNSPQAKLDISSTTDGVLLPRMTTTQVNAISSPQNGLTVYNTTLNTLCFFNGSSWQKVSHTAM